MPEVLTPPKHLTIAPKDGKYGLQYSDSDGIFIKNNDGTPRLYDSMEVVSQEGDDASFTGIDGKRHDLVLTFGPQGRWRTWIEDIGPNAKVRQTELQTRETKIGTIWYRLVTVSNKFIIISHNEAESKSVSHRGTLYGDPEKNTIAMIAPGPFNLMNYRTYMVDIEGKELLNLLDNSVLKVGKAPYKRPFPEYYKLGGAPEIIGIGEAFGEKSPLYISEYDYAKLTAPKA